MDESTDADVTLAGLKIWIHGRQFPDDTDYWDGNWVAATALCKASGARVEIGGSILHLSQIKAWLEGCVTLAATLTGEAKLGQIEPNLDVTLRMSQGGHMQAIIEITPDQMSQIHKFSFELDQTYLPRLISELKDIIRRFPIVGTMEQV